MIKISIDKIEWYPFYDFVTKDADPEKAFGHGNITKIPKEKLDWLKKVRKEFIEAQDYLENLFNNCRDTS